MFKSNIDIIFSDLQKYKRDKKTLVEYYLNDRLDKSLNTYITSIDSIVLKLSSRNSLRLLKKLNKDY